MSTSNPFTLTSPTQQLQHPEPISPSPHPILQPQKRRLSFYQQPQSFLLTSSLNPSLNSINQIYNSTKQFITQIDNRISKSNHKKEMTEMKSSQKYHHMVKSYEAQITRLKKRLKLEESITNPTKQYINDILSQLVAIRRQNEGLKKQADENKHSIGLLRTIIDEKKKARIESPSKDSFNKSRVEKLPSISIGVDNIKENLDKYLAERALIVSGESKFDRFLKDWKKHQSVVDLNRLLGEIDKWIEGELGGSVGGLKQVPEGIRLRYHLNHVSPVKKSRKKINSVDFKSESTDFEQFTMPPEESIYSTRKMIRKREIR